MFYFCAFFLFGAGMLQAQNDLIITGAFDGPNSGGTPKGVELYVVNDIADLSVYGLGSANNGGGTDDVEYVLPAVAATTGDFLYFASESTEFNNFFGFEPDGTDNAMSINGDDAIELFYDVSGVTAGQTDATVVDVFGDIDVDGTGQVWDHVDGWAYRNDGTGPEGSTFMPENWMYSGVDAFDGQASNATAVIPFPLGTYSATVTTSPIIRFIEVDPVAESVTIKNFGTGEADISNYNICLGPGSYDALSEYASLEGDLTLSPAEEVTIDISSSTGNVTALGDENEGVALFLDASNFGSSDPAQLLDYIQYGAADQDRVDQAVAAGRWDNAANFVNGEAPYSFIGAASEFGSAFWTVGGTFTLQLLHYADVDGNEAVALDAIDEFSALVDGFQNDAELGDNTLTVTSGDIMIPGPRYFVAEQSVIRSTTGSDEGGHIDVVWANAFGVDAATIGNHELDQGTGNFYDAAFQSESRDGNTFPGSEFPWLSANIGFGADDDFGGQIAEDGQLLSEVTNQVAGSAIALINGNRIGIVGAASPTFPTITSTAGLTFNPGVNFTIEELAAEIQPSVDALIADGVDKIVLLSHMQQIDVERGLASELSGVDIVVAGGSNTRMGNVEASATYSSDLIADDSFDEPYPFVVDEEGRDPVLVVNVDGDYKYLGRLVVDFTADGVVDLTSLDVSESSSFASTEENVLAVGGTEIEEVVDLRDLVNTTIDSQRENVIGYTAVYLDGRRSQVRTQETNLGNLTADANLWYANLLNPDGDDPVLVSIKNGGGIRAEIGTSVIPPGSTDDSETEFFAPENGEVSEFDLNSVLRFNNGLVRLTLTSTQLLEVIEHAISETEEGATPGQFPQIAGMSFTYDPDATTGDRVVSMIVEGETGDISVVEDSELVDAAQTFNIVTLNFLANGGDDYPFDAVNIAGNRINFYEGTGFGDPEDFDDATLTNDPGLNNEISDTGGEQDALTEYMLEFHPETNPFAIAETPQSEDERIVNVSEVPNTDPALPLFVNTLDIRLQSTFTVPGEVFDESAAEIPAFDAARDQIFFTDANSNVVHVLDASDVSNLTLITSLALSGAPNSVAVYDTLVAVAVEADNKQENGKVEFWGAESLTKLGEVIVGPLPDMVTFNEDGTIVLTVNEGEPSDDYTVDPEGSVSIVTLNGSDLSSSTVATAGFGSVTIPDGVRIFGGSDQGFGDAATGTVATAAQDMEPEYITVEGGIAYVTCQENNALAIVDIETATVTSVVALGTQDHSIVGNGIDASDRDDVINIAQWPVKGMYMPDAIASYTVGGNTYLVTANEGDAREYEYENGEGEDVLAFGEEERVKDLDLDPTAFPDAEALQADEQIGRLTVTTINGDTDGDGDFDELYAYGTRSFTIWDAATGSVVWDSQNELEQLTAQRNPLFFNSTNDENNFDNRSDNKGPEPEGVTLGVIGATTYAFVGLERVGGIAVYDITDPGNAVFAGYVNNRNFSVDEDGAAAGLAGDLGPEGLVFVSADDSPTSTALLIVTNEVSGTVSIFEVGESAASDFSLAILHNSDGESQVLPDDKVGGIARFKGLVDEFRTQAEQAGQEVVVLSSGDNFLAGPELDASLALPDGERFYDAIGVEKIGYDALVLGNHDFDFGPDVLEQFIEGTDNGVDEPTTFLSANLDFTNEAGLQALVDAGRVASSVTVTKGGEQIGIIGLTTPNLPFISSPRDVSIDSDLVTVAQAEIDALETAGVNKIILISHLQGIEEELALVAQLEGLDVVIAGGGDDLLGNTNSVILPGDEVEGDYPTLGPDKNDDDVYFISTAGNYEYLGRLVVNFDAAGDVVSVGDNSGAFAVIPELADADVVVKAQVEDPVGAHVESLATTLVATSDVELDGIRNNIRGEETNLGNLITDAYLWQAEQVESEFGLSDQPRVAIANGGGIRNDNIIEAGEITALNTFEILPFGNLLSAVEDISPAQLKNLLENAVARIVTVDPAEEGGPTTPSGSGTGRFAQLGGISIVFDPTAEAITIGTNDDGDIIAITGGERIISATLDDGTAIVANGMIVDGAPDVTVLTADFTARGGDQYPFVDDSFEQLPFTVLAVDYQQALRNFLEAADGLNGSISGNDYPEEGAGRVIPNLTIELAKDLDQGRSVAVNAVISTNDYGFGNGQFYVQDEAGSGINVFYDDIGGGNADPLLFEAGDSTLVVGPFSEFSGQVQIAADTVLVLAEGALIPDGVEIAGADLSVDSPLQGARVVLENVSLTDATEWPTEAISSGSGVNVTVSAEDGTSFIVRIDRGESFYDASEAPNGPFTLEGTLARFNDDVQVFPFFQGDINTAPVVAAALTDVTEKEGFGTLTVDLAGTFADQYGDVLTLSAASGTDATATVSVTGTMLTITEVATGTSTIAVTATDNAGFTVTDEFLLTVEANNAPSGDLDDRTEDEGFGSFTIDLSGEFTDVDGDALSYTAESATEAVATVNVSGNTLTVTEVGIGTTIITVSADDGLATASASFTLTVDDVLGLDELAAGLSIYPIPATSEITIDHDMMNITEVRVISIDGRLIRIEKLTDNSLDVSDLKGGTYILELVDMGTGDSMKTKIIKQ